MDTQIVPYPGPAGIMLNIPGKCTVSVHPTLTDNCQLWSIGSFAQLFASTATTLEEIKDLLHVAHKAASNKALLLIDIQQKYQGFVEKLFPIDYIRSKLHYENTNSNKMCIYLIDFGRQREVIDNLKNFR